MTILRIEHAVTDFNAWKATFDSDPLGRVRSGVRSYQILRPTDDPNYVMIDLVLDTRAQAEAMLTALRGLWGRVEGQVMMNPQTRIAEVVESKEY